MEDYIKRTKEKMAEYLEAENQLKWSFVMMSTKCDDRVKPFGDRKWCFCKRIKDMCNYKNCLLLKG
jgi:hypothetical protein